MSYDIRLEGNITVPAHTEGGTYVLGGSGRADLNVTYNYGKFFYDVIDSELGIRWLYGKTGAETSERLADAVAILGTEQDDDYWASTPGNAGHALNVLLEWARLYPEAVWRGD